MSVVLAQKLLNERGEDVSQKKIEALKEIRLTELRQPDKESDDWIWVAYLMAFLGGLGGIIIGKFYASSKKTLANGETVFRYSTKKQTHGKIIYKLGWGFLIFWVALRAFVELIDIEL